MTIAIIIPLILIIGYMLHEASPVLSADFLLKAPERGMKAGGIWPALLGLLT